MSNPTPSPTPAAKPAEPVKTAVSNVKPLPQVTKAFVFDEEKWNAKLLELETVKKEFAGKVGHNPYLGWNKFIQPLIGQHEAGDNSEMLFSKLMAISADVLTVKVK